jgi:hypothetical protein
MLCGTGGRTKGLVQMFSPKYKKVVVWLVKKRSGNLPPLDAVGDVRHDNFWFVVGRQSYSIGKTGNSHSCEWCHFTDGLFGERLQHFGMVGSNLVLKTTDQVLRNRGCERPLPFRPCHCTAAATLADHN